MDKLSINNEMTQFDRKNREFYDELTDEERKKFSTYLMLRYGASVEGTADLQEWYLRATNERMNINFFDLGKHPKLQWLLATTVSPGMGTQRHQWIAPKKKEKGDNDVKKTLMSLMPAAKMSDIETLSKLITKKELQALLDEHGNTNTK